MSLQTTCLFLFDFILYVPSTIFQLNRDRSSWVEPVLSWDKCVLLKDHNAVTPVRLEPAAPRSWVKHSTTEPLRSLNSLWKTFSTDFYYIYGFFPLCFLSTFSTGSTVRSYIVASSWENMALLVITIEDEDQPAHLCSLISTLVISLLGMFYLNLLPAKWQYFKQTVANQVPR